METADGEVTLRPATAQEFFGHLSAGRLDDDGARNRRHDVVVAGGSLTVDGAAFQGPGMGVAGRTLEFEATFSGNDQSIGFSGTTAPADPMAMFIVKSGNLYARSINGAKVLRVADVWRQLAQQAADLQDLSGTPATCSTTSAPP